MLRCMLTPGTGRRFNVASGIGTSTVALTVGDAERRRLELGAAATSRPTGRPGSSRGRPHRRDPRGARLAAARHASSWACATTWAALDRAGAARERLLSVVAPCFNEAQNLPELVGSAAPHLRAPGSSPARSSSSTMAAPTTPAPSSSALRATHPNVVAASTIPSNRGIVAAWRSGVAAARGRLRLPHRRRPAVPARRTSGGCYREIHAHQRRPRAGLSQLDRPASATRATSSASGLNFAAQQRSSG